MTAARLAPGVSASVGCGRQPRWQAASASDLAAAGIGEALMTSAQTSLPAARAPARSPWAALLQMPSTLAFRLEESVGSLWMIDLHAATACATPAAVVGMLVGTLGVLVAVVVGDVDVVPVLVVVVGEVDVVPVLAVVLAGWATLVELLDVELLLPQPARSAPLVSARTSNVECRLIMCPPLV